MVCHWPTKTLKGSSAGFGRNASPPIFSSMFLIVTMMAQKLKTVLGTNQLFTTFNGSRTRCEAVFPGNEASISIFQIIFPSFSAKSVHSSVNLPARGEKRENGMSMGAKIGPLIMSIFLLDFARDACWPVQHAP